MAIDSLQLNENVSIIIRLKIHNQLSIELQILLTHMRIILIFSHFAFTLIKALKKSRSTKKEC